MSDYPKVLYKPTDPKAPDPKVTDPTGGYTSKTVSSEAEKKQAIADGWHETRWPGESSLN